jgi:Carboxypeptidase regulatory-like domain
MHISRNAGALLLPLLLGTMLRSGPAQSLEGHLPDAPSEQFAEQESTAQQTTAQQSTVSGTVTDPHGAYIIGATVTLEGKDPGTRRTLTTGDAGSFSFTSVQPGTFKLTVISSDFATFIAYDIVLHANESRPQQHIQLRIASANTNVDVVFSRYDLAEEQMHAEEKQRVIGIFPNFYVTYNWNATPLTAGQKFRLALRTAVDPVAFLGAGFAAGVEQWGDAYSGYGQGAQGYGKRFGASYADAFDGTMIGGAILPSLLHQDPRYFYKGTGTIRSRALYAISTVVICKGDNGRWQPNYSNVLGSLAGAGISNLYYPSTDRHGVDLTIGNALIGTASGAVGALFQEFLIKKISRGIPPTQP